MPVSRRQFLTNASWAFFAAAAYARNTSAQPEEAASSRDAFSDWGWVRSQFNLSPEYSHFSQFFIVSHPRPVREAIERLRHAMDANPFLAVEHGLGGPAPDNQLLRAQQAAANYMGAKPDEIALVDSTTEGLALIYNGMPLKRGDEILTTTHDHYVHHEAIRLATQKLGASHRRVALYARADAVTVDEVVTNLRRAIGRKTRVVGLTWVHSSTGVKLPIRQLAAVVSEANGKRGEKDRILLVVDGVHGFGSQDESPVDMGCDFFVAGTHKWIFAPRGTGIIWGRRDQWAHIRPTVPAFHGLAVYAWMEGKDPGPTQASFVSPGGFKAYEHQWAMPEAFAFHQSIGRKRIADRIAALNTQCKEGLAGIPLVKLHTPHSPELSAGIICFEIAGMAPEEAVRKLLEKKVIASKSPYKVSYARLAPSLVNDEEQVEHALRAVRALS